MNDLLIETEAATELFLQAIQIQVEQEKTKVKIYLFVLASLFNNYIGSIYCYTVEPFNFYKLQKKTFLKKL